VRREGCGAAALPWNKRHNAGAAAELRRSVAVDHSIVQGLQQWLRHASAINGGVLHGAWIDNGAAASSPMNHYALAQAGGGGALPVGNGLHQDPLFLVHVFFH